MTVSNQVPNNQGKVGYQALVDHELQSQHDFGIRVELLCTLLGHVTHLDLVSKIFQDNVQSFEIGPE